MRRPAPRHPLFDGNLAFFAGEDGVCSEIALRGTKVSHCSSEPACGNIALCWTLIGEAGARDELL